MGDRRLDELLEKTSRTFALTIPRLPDPTRAEVTVAYLLFRIADTLEDATLWTARRKADELGAFGRLLDQPTPNGARALAQRWSADPPLTHAGYLELLRELPLVCDAAAALDAAAGRLVRDSTARTTREMRAFVIRETEGALRLRDLADLERYCYAVAGIVGELLTELFLLGRESLRPIAGELRADAAKFGEALQLVNILKDEAPDATEGRHFLPAGVQRARVMQLARGDLASAARYCERLERAGAEPGLVAFNVLPLLLARATLDHLEEERAGTKISRDEVASIVRGLDEALPRREAAALLTRPAISPEASLSRTPRSPWPDRE